MLDRSIQKTVLAAICGLMLSLLPIPASAQFGDIKKGAEKGAKATEKGAETVVDKTKEGAEKTGDAVKDVFTGDDDKNKNMQNTDKNAPREKPSATQPGTTAPESNTESNEEGLPRTAGSLPVVLFTGGASLVMAGALQLIRKKLES